MTLVEAMEDNENSFVSFWCDKFDLKCATLYANKVMYDDPFFNRVTCIRCDDLDSMISDAEKLFHAMNVKPFIQCMDENIAKVLEKHNFTLYDKLSVLLYENKILKEPSGIRVVDAESIDLWVDTFCSAYNIWNWRDEIRVRACSLSNLYLAYIKDNIAGCMALFEKNSLLGLYCLGTIERYRKIGVASALISYAINAAKENKLRLFLQTFVKDNIIGYYVKRGFTQIYVKYVYTK